MCKYLGINFRCGCFSNRCLSNCRATFVYPNPDSPPPSSTRLPPTKPLCSQNASFVIALTESCVKCKYEDFSNSWNERIAEAARRRDDLSAQLREKFPESAKWASSNRYSGWNTWAGWGEECSLPDENSYDCWVDAGYDMDGSNDCLYGSHELDASHKDSPEKATLVQERNHAAKEATELQSQFDRENWEWQSRLFGLDLKPRRRRRMNTKLNGGSPLINVENADDFSVDTALDTDETDCDSNECDTSPTLSNCSTLSALPNHFELINECDSEDPEIEVMITEANAMTTNSSLEKGSGIRLGLLEIGSLLEDSDEVMLPVWLDSF